MKSARSVGIRGAGLAGLALARRIVEFAPRCAVTVFDTRPSLPHPARTFCFFRSVNHQPMAPAVKAWGAVRFVGAEFDRVIDCREMPYTLVRGEDYFQHTLDFLGARGVEFRWGCRSVDLGRDGLMVEGKNLPFDIVVDAAFDSTTVAATLWQSFGGMVVEATTPVFDSECATLMEFESSTVESPVGFVYVLPFSPTEALVEHTTFSVAPLNVSTHLSGCAAWLRRHRIEVRREISRESGAIPMGITRPAAGRWPVIGTAAGGVRAGTGYGFLGIHAQAERLAEAIASGGPVETGWRFDPTPLSLRIGDALFLRALRRAPLQGRAIIEGLLQRAADRDVVAFLSGRARLAQAFRVMAGVPRATMVRALCS